MDRHVRDNPFIAQIWADNGSAPLTQRGPCVCPQPTASGEPWRLVSGRFAPIPACALDTGRFAFPPSRTGHYGAINDTVTLQRARWD
jgi:hypothetical protein